MNDAPPRQSAPEQPGLGGSRDIKSSGVNQQGPRLRSHLLPCARLALRAGTWAIVLSSAAATLLVSVVLLVFRFVDPPASALMLTQRLTGIDVNNRWIPLSRMSPNIVRAVILSEDNKFCSHSGLDLGEMRAALDKADRDGADALRGASTISQQVAKNLFLWPGRSLARKALEIGITLPMELFWSKARIMEVYLNIAEWGPGVFGIEAASRHHFNKPASRLTQREAALLAAALPNPFERVAGNPGQGTQRLAATIESRMSAAGPARFECVLNSVRRAQ
jgi:monofunctional glycosyltransferase